MLTTGDLSTFATSGILSTATLAIPVPTSTSNTPGATTSTSTTTSKEKHAGVSTTEAVGIGVGSAALALIAAGAAGFFLWLRRRKQRIRAQIETPIPPPAPPPKDRKFRAPAPLKLDRGSGLSHGSSGVASVARGVNGKMIRGPFELHSRGKGETSLHEANGGYQSQSPIWTPKSTDHLRSNAATPSYWSPPPSYGYQPAELESPQRSVTSAGLGNFRGRAELGPP
ncbi:hypothetical protein SLS53_008453 [Cytospora paraplurivora]|uniref:Uncharacterized protein n=1 Tax=Cytospora paraplurivora TaxID=2898453 RepID=A0AAN9YCR7_9PEZI